MFERFTRNARDLVRSAYDAAEGLGVPEVRPAHLLEALAGSEQVLATQLLADLGVPAAELRRVVRALAARYADGLDPDDAEALKLLGIDLDDVIARIDRDLGGRERRGHRRTRFARDSKKVLELALREALRLDDGFIGTEHILLGLVRVGDRVVDETLAAFDLTADDVRRAVEQAERRTG